MFLVLKINALELIAGKSVYYDKNTCDWASRCYKSVPTFQILLRDMIHNSLGLTLM